MGWSGRIQLVSLQFRERCVLTAKDYHKAAFRDRLSSVVSEDAGFLIELSSNLKP